MKKFVLCLPVLALAACSYGQQKSVPDRYARYISVADAKKHLSIIASDAFEGRETGKPGADKAAAYLSAQFKKMGLQPANNGSYYLNVPLEERSLKVAAFEVNGHSFENGMDFLLRSASTSANIHAHEVLFIGYGTPDEVAGVDLSGKVLIWINEDKPLAGSPGNTSVRLSNARTKIVKDLRNMHPAAILAVNPTVAEMLKKFGSSYTGAALSIKKEGEAAPVEEAPLIYTDITIADLLVKESGHTFDELKKAAADAPAAPKTFKANFTLDYRTEIKPAKAADVVALLPGSDPKLKDEVLVFSAHYDHIGLNANGPDKVNNGADDDGSGTTGILEIARAFSQAKKDGHGPRRSILFLGNVGEEKGLLGSEYYTDHPIIPLSRTITDLNIDMIGRVGYEHQEKADSLNYVYVIGSGMLSTDLRKINEDANNTYTHLELDYKYDDPNDPNRFYYRSDHYNFAKHGVPIIFYFDGEHQDYHRPSDEVSKINFPLLVKRAQLVFYTGWNLANRDTRPVVDAKTEVAK